MSKRSLIEPKKIKGELQTDFIGQEIYHFTEATSTNDVAKELAIKGAKEGTLVIAETQRRGRGRFGRKWISPEGGMWFSIILRPKVAPEDALKLTLMAAVVVAKVISDMFKLEAEVKSPNDVVVDGKKVCGILTEMSTKDDTIDFVVIGVGINANVSLDSFPKDLRKFLTSLKEELKEDVDRKTFLCALLEELERCYKMFTREGLDSVLEDESFTSFLTRCTETTIPSEKIKDLTVDTKNRTTQIAFLSTFQWPMSLQLVTFWEYLVFVFKNALDKLFDSSSDSFLNRVRSPPNFITGRVIEALIVIQFLRVCLCRLPEKVYMIYIK